MSSADLRRCYPDRFINVTNGIPWPLAQTVESGLSALLTQHLGRSWRTILKSSALNGAAMMRSFAPIRGIKHTNKQRLADEACAATGVEIGAISCSTCK